MLSRPKISPITTTFASSGGSSGTRAQIAPSSSSGGASNCQKRKPAASTEPSRAGGPANITSWPARSNARANGTSGLKCPAPRVEVNRARMARQSDARGSATPQCLRWPEHYAAPVAVPTLRYLTRADVEAVGLTGIEVLGILEDVFRAKRDGAVEMPAKIGVHPRDDAFIHAMPAYLESADAVGIKWVAGYPGNQDAGLPYIHGLFVLTDAGTGAPLAVMDATWITEIRTAAASMLGIRALAERPVETLGILGCGRQGSVHLELAKEVFPGLARVTLFDRHPERAEALAASHPTLEMRRPLRSRVIGWPRAPMS